MLTSTGSLRRSTTPLPSRRSRWSVRRAAQGADHRHLSPEQQQTAYPYFVDYLRRYLTAKYGPEKVFRGGLRIQSTLDVDLQTLADKTVTDALKGTQAPLEMSLSRSSRQPASSGARRGPRLRRVPGQPRPRQCAKVVVEQETAGAPMCLDGGGTGASRLGVKPFTLAKAFEEGMSPSNPTPRPRPTTYRAGR